MFLTNNSPDLCVLTLCIKFRQKNLYLASCPRISVNLNENYRRYNFQALANISKNLQPLLLTTKWKISYCVDKSISVFVTCGLSKLQIIEN